ncbi:MAG: bifunctional shikimate kinase/3-dehydroquinate synthase [Actinomycetota bacterium]|nr:bifunctional shikimate kinase/3-dehydroquinate synthase [Actinomycetota bacterium]
MEALTSDAGASGSSATGGALVLVGFMGAGKSTSARWVAAELGVEALDSDRELEARLGEPIEAFFDREGEAAFRAREEEVVLELLARPDAEVVALGGGAPTSERVREALRGHIVVHLEVEAEEAWRRATGKGRPLARDRGRFDQLHGDREALYASAADAVLPHGGREAARGALPGLLALREARRRGVALRMVWAQAESGSYPVFVGQGLIAAAFFHPEDARRFVVTDANVAGLHRVEGEHTVAIAAGEESKTIATAESVLRALARAGAERGDVLAAVGGGVVGDLAGFCAAIYQRGMAHVQVPTTLVAQVDSAYGGKTGVDLPEGKNYAGAYHQPSAVVCDPAALETLPREEHAAGYAEVVKTALIAGGPLWARVRAGGEVDEQVILGCLRTKLATVAADERDGGRRQVLNLGHTVGHAIEAATGYARYRHGEAVALGLLAALRLSGKEALRREVAELLSERGLPLSFSGASVDEVVALTDRDKKRSGGRIPFVLVGAPGEVTPGHEVRAEDLRAAVEELSEA